MCNRTGKLTEKVEKYKNAEEEEKEIVQEMFGDIKKYFNYNNHPYANQQLIGCKDSFRGAIVK